MFFSVPISSRETIVDTPLDCKSIRSFHFFDRYGRFKNYGQYITMYIDGKCVCDNLFVFPFMDSPMKLQGYVVGTRAYQDWRKISVPCLKNCDMDEIKIVYDHLNYYNFEDDSILDLEVVFEYSTTPVEEEKYYHIENFVFDSNNHISASNKSIIPFTAGEEVVIETHEEAEKMFCLDMCATTLYGDEVMFTGDFNAQYDDYYYQTHGHQYKDGIVPSPHWRVTIHDLFDVMPSALPVEIMSPRMRRPWKDVVYTLNQGLSKHPHLTIDSVNPMYMHTSNGDFYFYLVLFLIHECKF